jgi:hypothetical protein
MKSEKKKSVFETLSAINVNEHKEKKGKMTFLSWAWAWNEVKKLYPEMTTTVYENAEGLNYHHDGKTAWVKTGVTIEGQEYIEYLPIMDFHNSSIPIERLSSTDVNKGIQRGLTKAIARHGLGFYIYAGEDLPEAEVAAKNTAEIEKAEQEAKDQNLVNQYIQKLDKALSDFDPSAVQEVFSEIAEDKDRLKSRVYNGLQGDVKDFVTESMTNEEAA